MSNNLRCTVLVLGGGPGGYVAAIRAARLGLDTILVERHKPGGTCLNVGCIPSKALIQAAEEFNTINQYASRAHGVPGISAGKASIDLAETMAWKNAIVERLNAGVESLLKRSGAQLIRGHGTMVDGKHCRVDAVDGVVNITSENVILATGSKPMALPGIAFSEDVISSTEALSMSAVPRKLVVIGGGYIGLELGMAFAKFGSNVTVVEAEHQLLSMYAPELVAPVMRRLDELGVDVLTGARAESVSNRQLTVTGNDSSSRVLDFDKLLVTVGRTARVEGWGFEDLAIDLDGPFIKVNRRCETSMSQVYAVGDVTGEPMLAHRAMAQGDIAARVVAGQNREFDPVAIPAVVFTDPEIVVAGMSLDEARAAYDDVLSTTYPFAANGRAMTMGGEDGYIQIISRRDDQAILGLAATGKHVSELSSAFSITLEMGACLEDLASIIHAHPTQSEGLPEAALKALGEGLHF